MIKTEDNVEIRDNFNKNLVENLEQHSVINLDQIEVHDIQIQNSVRQISSSATRAHENVTDLLVFWNAHRSSNTTLIPEMQNQSNNGHTSSITLRPRKNQ